MAAFEVSGLPDAPSAAAAVFQAKWLPQAEALLNPPPTGEGDHAQHGGGVRAGNPEASGSLARTPPPSLRDGPPPRVGEDLVIAFDAADYTHAAWRLAIIQALAREHAPARVNAISGGGHAARLAAVDYLEAADGVTGQVLQLDDAGAGPVVEPAQ